METRARLRERFTALTRDEAREAAAADSAAIEKMAAPERARLYADMEIKAGANPYYAAALSAETARGLAAHGKAARDAALSRLDPALAAELREHYEAAAAFQTKFGLAIREASEELGYARAPITTELKSVGRASEKVIHDYGGDTTKIKDLLRATVVMDSIYDVQRTIDALGRKFNAKVVDSEATKEELASGQTILEVKRNTLNPDAPPASPSHYRDALTNLRLHRGAHTYEIQANVWEMLLAKEKEHPLYEEAENIRRKRIDEGKRPYTLEETARLAELVAKQHEVYKTAWAACLSMSSRNDLGLPENTYPSVTSRLNARSDNDMDSMNRFRDTSRGSSLSQAKTTQSGPLESGIPSQSPNSVPSGNLSGSFISHTSTVDSIAQGRAEGQRGSVQEHTGAPLAPRHDTNKNQAVLHVEAMKNLAQNIEALRKIPALENHLGEDMQKLAYWRGIVAGETASSAEKLSNFDRQAADPRFLERLETKTSEHQPAAKTQGHERDPGQTL